MMITKRKLIILSIIFVIFVFAVSIRTESRGEWCATNGSKKETTRITLFGFVLNAGSEIKETVISKYINKLSPFLTCDRWVTSGMAKGSLIGFHLEGHGIDPLELYISEDDLDFIYKNDRQMLREILEHVLKVSADRQKTDIHTEMLDLTGNRDIEAWTEWWMKFKEQNT